MCFLNKFHRCCMLENMLKQCHQSVDCSIPSNPYSVLFKDTSSKCYKPLLSRPTARKYFFLSFYRKIENT